MVVQVALCGALRALGWTANLVSLERNGTPRVDDPAVTDDVKCLRVCGEAVLEPQSNVGCRSPDFGVRFSVRPGDPQSIGR